MSNDNLESTIRLKAERMIEIDQEISVLKGKMKALDEEYDQITLKELPDIFENAEIKNLNFEGIGTLYKRISPKVTVLKQDEPAFFNWLKENNHGDIIKETVHWKTLNGWAKEVLEEGMSVPEMCRVFYETRVVIRRG